MPNLPELPRLPETTVSNLYVPCEIYDDNGVLVYDKIKVIISEDFEKYGLDLPYTESKKCFKIADCYLGLGAITPAFSNWSGFAKPEGCGCGISNRKVGENYRKDFYIDKPSYKKISNSVFDAMNLALTTGNFTSWSELKAKKAAKG